MSAPHDVVARNFPRELDGHPLLAWMGDDWVDFVIRRVHGALRRQDGETVIVWIACEGEPQLETRMRGDGQVAGVELSLRLAMLVRDSASTPWRIQAEARFSSAGVAQVELASTERARDVGAARFRCAICGAEAGRVEVDDAGGRPEVRRSTFTGTLTQPLSPDAAERVAAALDAVDAAALHALDAELSPFFCPDCAAVYCGEHMAHWDVFDDDGFHDAIRGRCPHGHERLLED